MTEKQLDKKKLFNPDVEDNIRVMNGTTTNILDLSHIPKESEIFHKLFDALFANNWLPHKTNMGSDKYDYEKRMTEDERVAYEDILSFLAFLDSVQTNNIPNISEYCTDPHIVYVLARQAYDECIHSKSYGWIFSSIMTKEKAKAVYNRFKENPLLLERNKFIAEIYQDFVDNPTDLNYLRSIVANYLLEGIYFYNGFQFFHTLANRGLITGTNTQISYIKKDEIIHCAIFENIIKRIQQEEQDLWNNNIDMIYDMFKVATEWEIRFSQDTIGDKILGMSKKSIEQYAQYLCDLRLKNIKLKPIYGVKENPYKHLDKIAGEDETSNRTNNFEATSTTYKSHEILDDWDDL